MDECMYSYTEDFLFSKCNLGETANSFWRLSTEYWPIDINLVQLRTQEENIYRVVMSLKGIGAEWGGRL